DVERGLLVGLAARRVADAFPRVDESAGNRPAVRRVSPLDEHDAVADLDHDVDRGQRVGLLGHGCPKQKRRPLAPPPSLPRKREFLTCECASRPSAPPSRRPLRRAAQPLLRGSRPIRPGARHPRNGPPPAQLGWPCPYPPSSRSRQKAW